jgi:hypothetical protein
VRGGLTKKCPVVALDEQRAGETSGPSHIKIFKSVSIYVANSNAWAIPRMHVRNNGLHFEIDE